MENHMNKNKGFSLIELLIAITLLSIVMIMVTQFMGTTSGALTKTKKNLNIQTEAMEAGGQISDSLMQATYIRVRTQDNKDYELDTELDGTRRKREESVKGDIIGDLVVDNYPNYLNATEKNRDIILDESNYTLINKDKATYPVSGDEDMTSVQSFRILTRNKAAGEQFYVKPEYIYMRYQKKEGGSESEAYVIYYFENDKIYMDRGELSALAGGVALADGFQAAVSSVNSKKTGATGENGLLTEHISDCYFSADTEADTVFLNMLFENKRYKGYTYNYEDTILLRNSNVLTVVPQKMYKKK